MVSKALVSVLALCLVLMPCAPVAARQKDEEKEEKIFTKHIVVSARRLSDESEEAEKVPANVTVITREDIERSPARSLQELLAGYAGVIVYDNVGNGLESVVDLRGFSEGTAMAVYVDGVRINEPDDNGSNLELLDLGIIERIEIIPGGASFSHGNGALSGTIKIYTRRGYHESLNELYAGYGGFATTRAGVRSGNQMGPHSYFLSYSFLDSDGFRENGAIRQNKLFGKYDYEVPGSFGIELSLRYTTGKLGNPGALTPGELAENRRQNPYNLVDFNRTDESVFTARYSQHLREGTLLTLTASRREADIEVLTTGRYAALWGGFRSKSDNVSTGLAGQVTYSADRESWDHSLSVGFEVTRDEFGNEGFYTDLDGNPTYESNDRKTAQDNRAVYLQGTLDLGRLFTLTAAARYDEVGMDFSDNLSNDAGDKVFNKTTGMAGLNARLASGSSLFLRYSQAFQTPTVNDLFAFPLFGSNPDLQPTTGETWEGGLRASLGEAWTLQAAIFRMDLENEVVFVITDPIWFIGSNENVGRSLRSGIEMQIDGQLGDLISLLATYTYTKAENLSLAQDLGVDELRIPLVPDHKLALRSNVSLGALRLGGELLYVGKQVIGSDDSNSAPLLDDYAVVNLCASYKIKPWILRVDLLNAFDREYVTRGIYSSGATYLTPAPGRQIIGTLEFRY
jgi:iron complex outermembrane receptor protein